MTALTMTAPPVTGGFLSALKDGLADFLQRRNLAQALVPLQRDLKRLAASAWLQVEHDAAEFDDVAGAIFEVVSEVETWRVGQAAAEAMRGWSLSARTLKSAHGKLTGRFGEEPVWAQIVSRTECVAEILKHVEPPAPTASRGKAAQQAALERAAMADVMYRQTLSLTCNSLERDALVGSQRAFVAALLLASDKGHTPAIWRAVAECWSDGLLKVLVFLNAAGFHVPLAVLPFDQRASLVKHAGDAAAFRAVLNRATEQVHRTGRPARLFPELSADAEDLKWP